MYFVLFTRATFYVVLFYVALCCLLLDLVRLLVPVQVIDLKESFLK